MSASPTTATAIAQPHKRPLEDPSSDSGPSDQPEAKRQAIDKDGATNGQLPSADAILSSAPASNAPHGESNGEVSTGNNGLLSTEENTTVPDGAGNDTNIPSTATATDAMPLQPIPTTMNASGPSQAQAQYNSHQQDETGWIHIRAIISSPEAATVIGKGGENVTEIRKRAGAKCTVSDYTRGAVERVLTVSGLVDAVAKAFGLIIRTLNNESLDNPSDAASKTYPLRLLIPHILTGSIIGQKGVRIREIQDASGARLNASDTCLPLSSERSLVVLGVADAVHIATYYVGSTLVEQLTERFGGPAASAYATRSGAPAGVVPGGMQVVPYIPQPAGGQWGHSNTYNRRQGQQPQTQHSTYGHSYSNSQSQHHQQPHTPSTGALHYGGGTGVANSTQAYRGAGPQMPQSGYSQPHMQPHSQQQHQQYPPQSSPYPGQPLTQQIYIPNDMVGAIIGKGGSKINEIRSLSGSVIKINEPQDNSNERLVTITGTQECNQMALYMLYQRLESEKHRV